MAPSLSPEGTWAPLCTCRAPTTALCPPRSAPGGGRGAEAGRRAESPSPGRPASGGPRACDSPGGAARGRGAVSLAARVGGRARVLAGAMYVTGLLRCASPVASVSLPPCFLYVPSPPAASSPTTSGVPPAAARSPLRPGRRPFGPPHSAGEAPGRQEGAPAPARLRWGVGLHGAGALRACRSQSSGLRSHPSLLWP